MKKDWRRISDHPVCYTLENGVLTDEVLKVCLNEVGLNVIGTKEGVFPSITDDCVSQLMLG